MWGAMGQYHYVRLRQAADADAINAALPEWERRTIPPQLIDGRSSSQADIMDMKLVPVADVHLGEAQQLSMTPGNDARTVATFSVVAVLILVMACINFVNLATARAGQRAREVSLRKVLGASRRQLIVQFLGESLVVATLAMLIALAVVELTAPLLSDYLDADFRLHYFGADGMLATGARPGRSGRRARRALSGLLSFALRAVRTCFAPTSRRPSRTARAGCATSSSSSSSPSRSA